MLRSEITNFPKCGDAPLSLLLLDGNCGPVTVWATLRYFRKRASSDKIIKACRYTKKHGTFAIAMALALREFGLAVAFYTETDPNPHPIEKRCYRLAARAGVSINQAIDLQLVCSQISRQRLPIVLYDTPEGDGHFSPLLGQIGRKLILPFDCEHAIAVKDFRERWNAPGIFRQCLIVS
jgi:hypothetical protein